MAHQEDYRYSYPRDYQGTQGANGATRPAQRATQPRGPDDYRDDFAEDLRDELPDEDRWADSWESLDLARNQFSQEFGSRLRESGLLDAAGPQVGGQVPQTSVPRMPVTGTLPRWDDPYRSELELLAARRRADTARTGRRWPLANHPTSQEDATLVYRLGVARGEASVDGLARGVAGRYVVASRLPGQQAVARTDLHAIWYYGLGCEVYTIDAADRRPDLLARYSPRQRTLWIDGDLILSSALPPDRDLDDRAHARLLLAWAIALRLTHTLDLPQSLAFRPVPTYPFWDPPQETLVRGQLVLTCMSELLCPLPRLETQLGEAGLGAAGSIPRGTGWRAALREWYGGSAAEVERGLLAALAQRNGCPPLFCRLQLDALAPGSGLESTDPLRALARTLPRLAVELPRFAERARAAEEHFSREQGRAVGVLLAL